mgnify:CR=1 FL=1
MKKLGFKPNGSLHPWRFRLVIGLLGLCCVAVAWRIVELHGLDEGFLKSQSAVCGTCLSPRIVDRLPTATVSPWP